MRIVRLVIASVLLTAVGGCSAEADTAGMRPSAAAKPLVLAAGEERTFSPGTLSAGDAITCVAGGLTVDVVVPKPRKRAFVRSKVAWEKDGSRASLRLDVRPTGRVVASCS